MIRVAIAALLLSSTSSKRVCGLHFEKNMDACACAPWMPSHDRGRCSSWHTTHMPRTHGLILHWLFCILRRSCASVDLHQCSLGVKRTYQLPADPNQKQFMHTLQRWPMPPWGRWGNRMKSVFVFEFLLCLGGCFHATHVVFFSIHEPTKNLLMRSMNSDASKHVFEGQSSSGCSSFEFSSLFQKRVWQGTICFSCRSTCKKSRRSLFRRLSSACVSHPTCHAVACLPHAEHLAGYWKQDDENFCFSDRRWRRHI